ncbi:MAG: carbohydrate binding domain-containing protein [Acholeplasmataceae bacterium]
MRKRIFALIFMLMFAVILVACGGGDETPTVIPTEEPTLSAITFSGATDVTIAFESEFNVFTGVTALGNNGVDYTAQITYLSTAPIDDAGNLDTTSTGVHAVRYEVRVGEVLAQRWRYITVEAPERPEGLVVNGDFALGTVFWDDGPNGFFVADGAALSLSIEDGALKAEVTAGSNVWTPRFGQQGIPFEQGQAYEVSFRAKASVVKTINVQVGELISTAPWFVDFKQGQTEHHQITTEWATYTFKFFMNTDNPRGGVLFEMGNVPPEGQLDATIWFDDISIVETEMGEDEIAPALNGVRPVVNLEVDDAFDPLAGVTAFDNIDGDITDQIDVTIYKVEGETETEVAAVDTGEESVYKIVYTVTDAAGNVTTAESIVTVILIIVFEYPGWRTFLNDWDGTAGEIVVADGILELNLSAINAGENWQIQIIQDAFALGYGADNDGHMELEAGRTYRVTFDAKATTAGNITLAIGHSVGGWTPYFVDGEVAVTTEMQSFSIEFTLDDAEADYSVPAQFKLEMGMLFAGAVAPQTFTLDNVAIEVLEGEAFIATDLIFNGTMDEEIIDIYALPEWRGFVNFWEGTVGELKGLNGELVFMVSNVSAMDANWKVQVIQDAFALGTGEDNVGHMAIEADKTYKVTFDARATIAGNVTLAIGHAGGGWTPYFVEAFAVTNSMQTFEFIFTTDDDAVDYTVPAQFKLEMGLLFAGSSAGSFFLDNVLIEVLDGENYVDAGLIENGMMLQPEPYLLPQWRGFVNFWEGTVGTLRGVAGELVFMVSNISAMDANWKVQVIQDAFALGTGEDNVGHMAIEADKTYKVTFNARASVAGEVNLAIGHAGGGWTPYFMEVFDVTTGMQAFEFIFTTDNDAVDYSVPAQFKLEMGLLFAGLESGVFYLDNVLIEVMEGEAYVDAELIENGTFEAPIPYALNEWRGFVNFWEGTVGVLEGVAGELRFMVSNISAMDANWKVQVIQDAFALGTGEDNVGHMAIEADKTYKVTFHARASVAGEVNLAIGHAGGGWTPYFMEVFNITTDMQAFEFIFTTDDVAVDYSVPAQFKLEMGLLFAGLEGNQYFYLDNVLIEVMEGEAYVDAELIENGTMEYIEPVVLTRVYFYNNVAWTNLSAYVFGDAGEVFGGWPGVAATQDGTSDWYYVDVPLDPTVTVINIIFNNGGAGSQTADIVINGTTNVYIASNNLVYASKAEAEAAVAG